MLRVVTERRVSKVDSAWWSEYLWSEVKRKRNFVRELNGLNTTDQRNTHMANFVGWEEIEFLCIILYKEYEVICISGRPVCVFWLPNRMKGFKLYVVSEASTLNLIFVVVH